MKHHAQLAGGLSDPRDVVPRDEGTRVSGERSTTPNLPETHPTPKTWCPVTKEQGLAGSEAPRPICRSPIRPQRRGASRRRNKGQRGTEHHAHPAVSPSAPKGVVPRDEGIRVSGERSTTPTRRSAHPPLETWCPATKEQGLAGSGAPRPTCRRPESPNQWRGHGVESLGGRRPQQAGTPTRPRPAEASSKPTPAPPAGDSPTWCRRSLKL